MTWGGQPRHWSATDVNVLTELAQAAANQGVMQIYSVDTTAAAGATEKVAQTGIADNLSSMLALAELFQS